LVKCNQLRKENIIIFRYWEYQLSFRDDEWD
jgi:hypothetical protein